MKPLVAAIILLLVYKAKRRIRSLFKSFVSKAPRFKIPRVTSSYHYQTEQRLSTHGTELIDIYITSNKS